MEAQKKKISVTEDFQMSGIKQHQINAGRTLHALRINRQQSAESVSCMCVCVCVSVCVSAFHIIS